jgi:hypothetical protein
MQPVQQIEQKGDADQPDQERESNMVQRGSIRQA